MNVIVVSTTFIPSVLLCGHCQLDYLEKQGELNYRFVISHFLKSKDIEWADVLVFLRSDADIDAHAAKLAKKAGKHLVYVLDDDILNVPNYLSSAPYYALASTKNNIRTIMSYCDTFLTTSPVLREKYGHQFKRSFLISEPSINRIVKKDTNEKIKIGFAGSVDRAQDLNTILKDTITQIHNKYGDSIEIEFMGAKPDFVDELGLTHLPYQDGYDAYTAYMAKCNWDIGLAPMPDTKFHSCKYFNKYVEYASFGIAGIYSNLKPYTFGIKDKENGLLVDNTTEKWVEAISSLIEDDELRLKISRNSLKEAYELYSLEKCSYDYLSKLVDGRNDYEHTEIPSMEFAKFIIFFKRVYRKIKEQGRNFPDWLMKKLQKKYDDARNKNRYTKNKEKLLSLLEKDKYCFVVAPYDTEDNSDYNKRINYIDGSYLKDTVNIYLSGEHDTYEYLETDFIDDRHIVISFNSYDADQTDEVMEMIKKSGKCLIHGVTRFMREKVSTSMFKVFDLENVSVIWDTHGNIPEEFHKRANFHTERVTNEIEKVFYEKSDVILCENNEVKDTLIKKYYPKDGIEIL